MSATDTPDEESTRPISVAELLARNGTIGAPPVGGHRRRRRKGGGVTVAELTGEMPVIRDEPVVEAPVAEAPVAEAPVAEDGVAAVEQVEVVEDAGDAVDAAAEEAAVDSAAEEVAVDAAAEEAAVDAAAEQVAVDAAAEEAVEPATEPGEAEAAEPAEPGAGSEVEPETVPAPEPPPLASDPLPRRGEGPELSHDPRPRRRSSGAEQMAYDPVDQAVDITELVGDQAEEEQKLRSYLRSSGGTLFSGETVADDLARRGITDDADPGVEAELSGAQVSRPAAAGGRLAALRTGTVAVLQSVLAVLFGAGLFIGFDQLWRWNTIVALVLSVLVILGLVVAVRVVRKTEDIASTLIAVAVGALVTLGPLALLQSYG